MATRRHFLTFSGLFVAGAALVRADDLCAVSTQKTQTATTADQALLRLKEGNERFRTDRSLHCNLMHHTSKNKKFVQSVADQNAKDAASQLTARSEVLATLVREHQLKIVSAMHDVGTGAVRWLA